MILRPSGCRPPPRTRMIAQGQSAIGPRRTTSRDGHPSDKRVQHFLEGLSQVEIPYGKIDWDRRAHFAQVDILAQLHEAWATHELLDHHLLDAAGMVQEFVYPEGKISIDLGERRYRIEGGPVATDGWVAAGMG
jgi:hypothetical protein